MEAGRRLACWDPKWLVWVLMIGWRSGVGCPEKVGAGWRGPGLQEALLALEDPGK